MKSSRSVVDRWQLNSKTEKMSSQPPGQGNLVDKNVITITNDYLLKVSNITEKPESEHCTSGCH